MKEKTFRAITIPAALLTLAIGIALPVAANNAGVASAADMYFGRGKMNVTNGDFKGDTSYVKSSYNSKTDVETKAKEISEKIEREGLVLLKNNGALPLKKNAAITLFGRTSVDPIYVGAGSGSITGETITYLQALQNEGFSVNATMSDFYKNHAKSQAGYQSTDFTTWQGTKKLDVAGRGFASYMGTAKFFGDVIAEVNADDIKSSVNVASSYASYSDAAVVVIGRIGGEGCDLPMDLSGDEFNYPTTVKARSEADKKRHYLELNDDEISLLTYVKSLKDQGIFKKIVVLVNSSNALEMGFVKDDTYGVDGAMWIGDIGGHGSTAIAKALDGTVNPSGRLVDTYLRDVYDNPAMKNFGNYAYSNIAAYGGTASNAFVQYEEGIYEGYRYYETAAAENAFAYDDKVLYPFGFGLSYTSFKSEFVGALSEKDGVYHGKVKVTNTGAVSGKTPIELYAESPYTSGGIEKSKVALIAFAKTPEIAAGNSVEVELTFKKEDLASYDYKNEKAYVLDQGEYHFYLETGEQGAHAWKASGTPTSSLTIASKIVYGEKNKRSSDDKTATNVFEDVSTQFKDSKTSGSPLNFSRKDFAGTYPTAPSDEDKAANSAIVDASKLFDVATDKTLGNTATSKVYTTTAPTTKASVPFNAIALRGLAYDDPAYSALLDSMDPSAIAALFADGGFKTEALEGLSLPATLDYDGPAGWSGWVSKEGLSGVSEGFPTEIVIGSTWNVDLAEEFGEIIGEEALTNSLNGWYAPAMNIHRTAFSGRNYEYYSEDPLLSGKMGANTITGAGKKGVYSYLKHFALNDQETNRWGIQTWANEQAIREIYLKPFEIAIKESYATVNYYASSSASSFSTTTLKGPMAIMNSYNCIGTTWAGGSYALMSEVLRNEWGFRGLVSTDYFGGDAYMNPDAGLRAGTDVFLATFAKPALADSSSPIALNALRRVMHDLIYTVVNSNAMNGIAFNSSVSYEMSAWKKWVYAGMGVSLAITVGLVSWNVVRTVKKSKKRDDMNA
jgi:beta-glucosidase